MTTAASKYGELLACNLSAFENISEGPYVVYSAGVISVAIEGPDKDQLVVIGEGVDVVNLTSSLQRKRRCWQRKRRCATLLRVEEVKEAVKPAVPKLEQYCQYPKFPECYQVVYYQDPYYPCFIL
ncbi:hypothetical protein CJ030_MR8G028120 [Morella rubra]|uniref:Uncharacterized protein n=1 Tax=Morella rubra TaxID=262757 RepID=A0A6A1UVM3_9ROSI|nr:hypothetical protein CJ030_MR8G028120 [Morella rubra]